VEEVWRGTEQIFEVEKASIEIE